MTTETTPSRGAGTFVLLEDFEHAYDNFSLKVHDAGGYLVDHILRPMKEELAKEVDSLESHGLEELRTATASSVDPRFFVVTLDGGTYFSFSDFSFEITRACLDYSHSTAGPYFRLPREMGSQLVHQALRLKRLYEERGASRPIVLCDDGIGTGGSLRKLIALLRDLHLQVHSIFVLLNPLRLTSLEDIEIHTLLPLESPHIWLSERDLYWGIPRSGISFASSEDRLTPEHGIPYTISVSMVESRIGLDGPSAARFRSRCLALNIQFWSYLERTHNRPLLASETKRLSFLSMVEGCAGLTVVEIIAGLLSNSIAIRLDPPVGELS